MTQPPGPGPDDPPSHPGTWRPAGPPRLPGYYAPPPGYGGGPPPGYYGPPPGYSGGPPPGYYGPPPPGYYGPPPGYGPGYGGYGQYPPPPRPGCVPLRPLGLGDILDGAFKVIRRNPRTTLGLSAVVALVSAVLSSISLYVTFRAIHDVRFSDTVSGGSFTASAAGEFVQLVGIVVELILGAVLTGMLTLVVTQDVLGNRLALGETWRRARPRIWRLLGLAVLGGLAEAGGIVLCIAPGVWLWGVWAVAVPACMVEGLGIRASFGRSKRLVTGTFWRVWGIRALGVLITWVVSSLIGLPFTVLGLALVSGSTGDGVGVGAVVAIGVGTLVAQTFTAPVRAAIDALLYVDLRMRREGLDIALQQAVAAPAGPVTAD